jgi:transcriptional regulator with XRE-family HTH domain
MTAQRSLGAQLKLLRAKAGLSEGAVEQSLGLGKGWVRLIESSRTPVGLDLLPRWCVLYRTTLQDLFRDVDASTLELGRALTWEPADRGLTLRFPYGKHIAEVQLDGADAAKCDELVDGLRGLLARSGEENAQVMSEAVASTFLDATRFWPKANPSDIWHFLISRAFLDPYNHPASKADTDLGQSWKRTGGWSLEQILVRHYGPTLAKAGVHLDILAKAEGQRLLDQAKLTGRVEAEKADAYVTVDVRGQRRLVGVIHVKASFAERRTDDVPMSRALLDAGYFSPLWTMDCKAQPSARPNNKGELGTPDIGASTGVRKVSSKRKNIEEDAEFSACFSYNSNTVPTPPTRRARARIYVCDFGNPKDVFFAETLKAAERIRQRR